MEQHSHQHTNAGARRLYKSRTDKIIGGVCGGLGEYLELDPVIIRLVAVILLFTGWGLPAYIIAWIIMPTPPEGYIPPRTEGGIKKSGYLPGFLLILLGSIFLLQHHWYWFDIGKLWPLLLIAIGLVLIFRSWGRRSQTSDYNSHRSPFDSKGPGSQ